MNCGWCGIKFGINATKDLTHVMGMKGQNISTCKENIESKYAMRYAGLSKIGVDKIQGKRWTNKAIDNRIDNLQDAYATDISL